MSARPLATLIAGFSLMLTACGPENATPENWVRGETGTVSRVIDGDSFALNTGQVVRLASVEAPSFGYNGKPDDPYADTSKKELEALALGRQVDLYYPGMTRDRYDRALAQVYLHPEAGKPVWLNRAIIEQGAGWVRLYPDTMSGSDRLWDAEAKARKDKLGVWKADNAPLRTAPDDLPDRGFALLRGVISAPVHTEDDCLADIADWPLVIVYSPDLSDQCGSTGEGLQEVRGWVSNNRLFIETTANIRPVSSGAD